LPSDDAIREAQQRVGWSKVQRAPGRLFLPLEGMGLDLGGMGKEFAVDQIGLLTRQFPLTGALIDFGADIRVVGLPPDGRPGWHIGLEDPQSPGRVWRGLSARDCAVATSGNYLRHFEIDGIRYGHILDPRTGRPTPVQVLAVSVLAPSCTQAGLLSTSALVLGAVEGLRLIDSTPGAAGVILTSAQTFQSRRFHEHVAS
jgi:thiamine biosynthesis lipoprotein